MNNTNLEITKKKLVHLANRRGIKELDLLLGNFVKEFLKEDSTTDLSDLEEFLLTDDSILFKYLFTPEELPSDFFKNPIWKKILNFKNNY